MLAACSSTDPELEFDQTGGASARVEGTAGRIVVRTDDVVGPFDPRLLGTNVPAWLDPGAVASEEFRRLTMASGATMLRLPGGSWSNHYDWLGCELDDPQRCEWTWALRPSDFLGLLEATGLPAMWTVSINGTAEEAAAAVAFFNGSVDDERVIPTDRNGREWQTVGHWARLRAERGHPEPAGIRYWEIGNEVYGATVESAGPDCASYGWEDVWTCDGAEYVAGTDDHDGFTRFREAMLEVDAEIEVGAVGVGDLGAWGDWDDEVIGAAGRDLDFYVVHHYGSNGEVPPEDVSGIPRREWPRITGEVREGFADQGLAEPPIAVTEHNLVAFIDGDDAAVMPTAVNALYLAETIGQMAVNGVRIANQWNLANGRWDNGSDYGLLVDLPSPQRSPAYFAMALWSRFGVEMVAVEAGADLDELGLYGGRGEDGSARLMIVNPSPDAVDATITAQPANRGGAVTAHVVAAESLLSTSVTWNGAATPSIDLTESGEVVALSDDGELRRQVPPFSITLLSWDAQP
jgi:hypothetical protein